MRIKHGRSKSWERAAARGSVALHARILRELARQLRRGKAKRDAGLTRTIPLQQRKVIHARSQEIKQRIAEDRVLRRAGLR